MKTPRSNTACYYREEKSSPIQINSTNLRGNESLDGLHFQQRMNSAGRTKRILFHGLEQSTDERFDLEIDKRSPSVPPVLDPSVYLINPLDGKIGTLEVLGARESSNLIC